MGRCETSQRSTGAAQLTSPFPYLRLQELAWHSQRGSRRLRFSVPSGWLVGGRLDVEQSVGFPLLNVIPACASLCIREWQMIRSPNRR